MADQVTGKDGCVPARSAKCHRNPGLKKNKKKNNKKNQAKKSPKPQQHLFLPKQKDKTLKKKKNNRTNSDKTYIHPPCPQGPPNLPSFSQENRAFLSPLR